jgi:transposase
VIEAIAWKYRTGVAWREIPTERFGPWQTVYERLSRWSADGTWARLLAAAHADVDARGELDWLVAADSSLVRVHQHGAAARRFGGNAATAPGPEPAPVTGGRVELQESAGQPTPPARCAGGLRAG